MAAQAGHVRTGRRLRPTWAAITLGTLITLLTVAGLVAVTSAGQSEGQVIRLAGLTGLAALGTLVASRRPGNPFGWLLLGAGLFLSVSDGAAAYVVLDYRLHGGRLPLGRLAVALEPAYLLGLVLVAVNGHGEGTFTLTAKGGPVSFSISAVSGLSVSPASGSLSSGATATITVTSSSLISLNEQLTVNPGGYTVTVVLNISL